MIKSHGYLRENVFIQDVLSTQLKKKKKKKMDELHLCDISHTTSVTHMWPLHATFRDTFL